MNFIDPSYLKEGSPIQRLAWKTLQKLELFKKLEAFEPVLTGTIPIDIAISSSDLDIICYCLDHETFIEVCTAYFSEEEKFKVRKKKIRGAETVVVKFKTPSFPIEIFAQSIPSIQQYAYRHMLIEHHLLEKNDDTFRAQIIAAKKSGLNTEAAFAFQLNIPGDPFEGLLMLEDEL